MPCNLGALVPGSLCAKLGAAGPPPGTFGSLADPTQSVMTECRLFVSRARAARGSQGAEPESVGSGPTWASQQLPDLGQVTNALSASVLFLYRGNMLES